MNIVKDLCTVVREVLATAVAVVGIATRMSLCQAIDGYRAQAPAGGADCLRISRDRRRSLKIGRAPRRLRADSGNDPAAQLARCAGSEPSR